MHFTNKKAIFCIMEWIIIESNTFMFKCQYCISLPFKIQFRSTNKKQIFTHSYLKQWYASGSSHNSSDSSCNHDKSSHP
uniref:Uncharacterized protein n=1 Tax=Rhizophora mucronata TaxID=61149 RepID=A0A2P2IUR8_RHIMU